MEHLVRHTATCRIPAQLFRSSFTSRRSRTKILALLVVLLTLLCPVHLQRADGQSGSQGGCYLYCCGSSCYDYCCGYYCYGCCCNNGCEYFISSVGSSYYWAGCSSKTVTMTGSGSLAQLYSGSYVNAYIQGSSSTLQVVSGTTLSTGYLQGAGSAASITGYVGTLQTSAASVSVYVAPGGQIGTLAASASSSASINVYGTISSSSSGGGTTTFQSGSNIGTHCQYSGSVTVIGTVSYLCGYGTFIITGAVTTLSTSGSSTISVRNGGSLTNLYLNGPSSTVYVDNEYITTIYLQSSGSSTTMTMVNPGSGFGNMIASAAINGLALSMTSSSNVGCIVFQQTSSNVNLVFTGTYFSRSDCHFVQFVGAATSSTISVQGSAQTYVTNYAAVKADSTVNAMLIYWSDSRLTTTGYDAFRIQSVIGSGLTITTDALYSCISCNMIVGNDRYKRLDAGWSALNIINGNSASSNVQVTLTSSTWSSYGNPTFMCTGAATAVTMTLRGSSFNYGSGHAAYFSSSVNDLSITMNSATLNAGGGDALYIIGNVNVARVLITNGGQFLADQNGIRIAGTTTSASITISDSGSRIYSYNQHSIFLLGAASTISIVLDSSGVIRADNANNIFFGNTATTVTITMYSSSTITSASGGHNLRLTLAATNVRFGLTSSSTVRAGGSTLFHNVLMQSAAVGVTMIADSSSKFDANGNNLFASGGSRNVVMYITSSSTVTSRQSENWHFSSSSSLTNAVATTQTNVISISGQSALLSNLDNVYCEGTASLVVSMIGASSASQVTVFSSTATNFHFSSTVQWIQITVTQAVLSTTGAQNVLAENVIGTVGMPNWILMTTSTIASPVAATSMEFQSTRSALTITASANCLWTAGGLGAISMAGASTTDVVRILSSIVTISTASSTPSVVQLNSGVSSTMNGATITMSAVAYSFTAVGPLPSTAQISFIRMNNNNFASSCTVTVFGCSFTVSTAATVTQRMEILDMQGATRITGGDILLAKIPYYSTTSCSTLPKGYGPCDALRRGAIVMEATTGTISGTTITVQCIEFSTTSLSFIDLQGTILNTFVRTDSVAIWQSQAVVALINFNNGACSGNQVRIVQTYIHMPIIVHSTAGAVGVSAGIAADCSFMSQYPMSDGFFEPALVPLVSRQPLPNCPKVFAPSCWITKSASLSLTITLSLTLSLSQSNTVTLSNEMTMSETRTVSMTISLARVTGTVTVSEGRTKSLTLQPTKTAKVTASRSTVLTLSRTVAIGTGTPDHHRKQSRTFTMSNVPTLSWSESIGTRSPSHSSTLSVTYSTTPSMTDSMTLSASTSVTKSAGTATLTPSEESTATPTESISRGTMSTSGTPEETLSDSVTVSQPPPTATETNSVTNTYTQKTFSREDTASHSSSFSWTDTGGSRSPTPTVSVSPESSVSPTATASTDPSVTTSPSESTTPTISEGLSETIYSPTETVSATPSASTEVSASLLSKSATPTSDYTGTGKTSSLTRDTTDTITLSVEDTNSATLSNTSSPSRSTTVTETESTSRTATPSRASFSDEDTTTRSTSAPSTLTPTESGSTSTSYELASLTTTISASQEPTSEATLSETQTWSTTVSWSVGGASWTRKRTRTFSQPTHSKGATESRSYSVTFASDTRDVSSEWSGSISAPSMTTSTSASLSHDPGSGTHSTSSSLSADGVSLTDSREATSSASRSKPESSLTERGTPSATSSEWVTATLSSSPSKDRRWNASRSANVLSRTVSASSGPSLSLRTVSMMFSVSRGSTSPTPSASSEFAYVTSTALSSITGTTSLSLTPARRADQGGSGPGGVAPPAWDHVTATLARLSETHNPRAHRGSGTVSLSRFLRVSASRQRTPSRAGGASVSTTMTISAVTHHRRIIQKNDGLGKQLSLSFSAQLSSESSRSASPTKGQPSATFTWSMSMGTSSREQTKSHNNKVFRRTEELTMSLTKSHRRGQGSHTRGTLTVTEEHTLDASATASRKSPTRSQSLSPRADSRSITRSMWGSETRRRGKGGANSVTVTGGGGAAEGRGGLTHSISVNTATSEVTVGVTNTRTQTGGGKRNPQGVGAMGRHGWTATVTETVSPTSTKSRQGGGHLQMFSATAVALSVTVSTTSIKTITPTITPSSILGAVTASPTLQFITDTQSRLRPTVSENTVSSTRTITAVLSETLTATLSQDSASLSCELPKATATPTVVHTPSRHRARLLGDDWRQSSSSASGTGSLMTTSTESVSMTNTTGKNVSELTPGGLLGVAAPQDANRLNIVGGIGLTGVPAALVLVNGVVMSLALLSVLMFASGMRRRNKKEPLSRRVITNGTVADDNGSFVTAFRSDTSEDEIVGDAVMSGQRRAAQNNNDSWSSIGSHPSEAVTTVEQGHIVGASTSDATSTWCLSPAFLGIVRHHVYGGVLFPCSNHCGWTHAAASCLHSNLTMLLAAIVGLCVPPMQSAAAFGIGLVALPLALLLVRWGVERLALPCLSCPIPIEDVRIELQLLTTGASVPHSDVVGGSGNKYLIATDHAETNNDDVGEYESPQEQPTQNVILSSPPFAPASSLRSQRTLDAIDLNLHSPFAASGKWSSASIGTINADSVLEPPSPFNEVIDLDVLALPPLAPTSPKLGASSSQQQRSQPSPSPITPAVDDGAFDIDIDVASLDFAVSTHHLYPTREERQYATTSDAFEFYDATVVGDDDDDVGGGHRRQKTNSANIDGGVPFYLHRLEDSRRGAEAHPSSTGPEVWFADGDFTKLPTVISGYYTRRDRRGADRAHDTMFGDGGDGDGSASYWVDEDGDEDGDNVHFFETTAKRSDAFQNERGENESQNRRGSQPNNFGAWHDHASGDAMLDNEDEEATCQMAADMLLMAASAAAATNAASPPPSSNRQTSTKDSTVVLVGEQRRQPWRRPNGTAIGHGQFPASPVNAANGGDRQLVVADGLIDEWLPVDISPLRGDSVDDTDPLTEPVEARGQQKQRERRRRSSTAWTDDGNDRGANTEKDADTHEGTAASPNVLVAMTPQTPSNIMLPKAVPSVGHCDDTPGDPSPASSSRATAVLAAGKYGAALVLVTLAIIVVMILLFGIRTYNSTTVSVMCGAFVGDVALVQLLRIVLARWWWGD